MKDATSSLAHSLVSHPISSSVLDGYQPHDICGAIKVDDNGIFTAADDDDDDDDNDNEDDSIIGGADNEKKRKL